MKVIFEEGKRCAAATEAPTGFGMDDYGHCFVTTWIPFGGTASLSFKETGTYQYILEVTPNEKELNGRNVGKGTVIVNQE